MNDIITNIKKKPDELSQKILSGKLPAIPASLLATALAINQIPNIKPTNLLSESLLTEDSPTRETHNTPKVVKKKW